MALFSIYSGDKLKVVYKADHDGFILVRLLPSGRQRYLRRHEIREEEPGELTAAIEEAPPWNM